MYTKQAGRLEDVVRYALENRDLQTSTMHLLGFLKDVDELQYLADKVRNLLETEEEEQVDEV